jgi:hypothetical protein
MITKSQCRRIREEEGTPGGITYHITKKGASAETALCFRTIPSKERNPDGDQRCSRSAGYNTDHVGTGACYLHGGRLANLSVVMGNITNGRKAYKTRALLANKIDNYLNGDSEILFDLSKELAAMRAIFEEFMEHMKGPGDDDYSTDIYRAVNLVGTIGTLVDKISRINSRNTLTSAQVLYLRATVADILVKYIRDPIDRESAVKELTSRVTGDELPDYNLVKREHWENAEEKVSNG